MLGCARLRSAEGCNLLEGHVAYCKQCLSLVSLVEGLVFTQKKRLSLLFRMVLKSKCQMLSGLSQEPKANITALYLL